MTEPQEDKSIKRLRRIVINMGVLLVVGTIALVIAVILKANGIIQPNKSQQKTVEAKAECIYKDTQLDVGSEIISATTKGNILTLLTAKVIERAQINKTINGNELTMEVGEDRSVQQVIIYDLCAGEVISRVDLVD